MYITTNNSKAINQTMASGKNNIMLCRICIESKCDTSVNIREDRHWSNIFEYCIGIPLSQSNIEANFQFCKACADKLQEYSNFKRRCIKSNNLWKSMSLKVDISKIKKPKRELEGLDDVKEEVNCYDVEYLSDSYLSDGDTAISKPCIENIKIELEPQKVKESAVKKEKNCEKESTKHHQADSTKSKPDLNPKEFKCDKCYRLFRNSNCLSRHKPNCTGPRLVEPPEDTEVSNELEEKKLASLLFYCGICDFKSIECDEVVKHFNEHAANNDLNCKKCEFVGRDFADMISHRYAHHPQKYSHVIFCPVCSEKKKTPLLVEYHYRSKHLKNPYPGWCYICDKKVTTFKSYRNHMKLVHSAGAKFICDYCGKEFLFKYNLVQHIISHLNMRNYICDACGKAYKKLSNLNSHIYSFHSNRKRVNCTHCDRTYTCERALRKHMLIVNKPKAFICEVCSKRFPTLSTLKNHSFYHTGEKPFSCDLCNKSYKAKCTLKLHMYGHLGYLPCTCQECGKQFLSKQHLKRHMYFHTGVRPIKCTYCDKTFYSQGQMLAHCKSRHKVQNILDC